MPNKSYKVWFSTIDYCFFNTQISKLMTTEKLFCRLIPQISSRFQKTHIAPNQSKPTKEQHLPAHSTFSICKTPSTSAWHCCANWHEALPSWVVPLANRITLSSGANQLTPDGLLWCGRIRCACLCVLS